MTLKFLNLQENTIIIIVFFYTKQFLLIKFFHKVKNNRNV